MFELGNTVRIKETAFSESSDPQDAIYRGMTGTLATDLCQSLGEGWHGSWEIEFDDGEITIVEEHEIELIN